MVFTKDGAPLASFETGEELRPDAASEVAALRTGGYEPFVLSGDGLEATKAMAEACGIAAARRSGLAHPGEMTRALLGHGTNRQRGALASNAASPIGGPLCAKMLASE